MGVRQTQYIYTHAHTVMPRDVESEVDANIFRRTVIVFSYRELPTLLKYSARFIVYKRNP